jgi:hypothetical protein
MAGEQDALREWHRLFGLLLTHLFSDSPFKVDPECDLAVQQQLLDVAVLRQRRGRFQGRLPDGMDGLVDHNLFSFKSHHEALDVQAIRELNAHSVAYRKLVSPSPSKLLPEDRFRLFAVCARFPHNLSNQVPWRKVQAGVYDCEWGTDLVRVIVTGELPREEHNAPLHLFSASRELVEFGRDVFRQRSGQTGGLLTELLERYLGEGFVVSFTMEEFTQSFIQERLPKLPPEIRQAILQGLPKEQQREFLQSLPPQERLEDLSTEEIRQYLEQRTTNPKPAPRKPRRKK